MLVCVRMEGELTKSYWEVRAERSDLIIFTSYPIGLLYDLAEPDEVLAHEKLRIHAATLFWIEIVWFPILSLNRPILGLLFLGFICEVIRTELQ